MRPALILPIGEKDWNNGDCSRLHFLLALETKLNELGWRPGWSLRGGSLPSDGWAADCARDAQKRGWALTWHPPFKAMFGIGKRGRLNRAQIEIGRNAKEFKDRFGLAILNVHSDALQYGSPGPAADLSRYNSRVTVERVWKFITNHISALVDLNRISGYGILNLENVHCCLFTEGTPNELPTYEAFQLGYGEIPWLARRTGINTTLDSEHFFGSRNFYCRENEAKDLPKDFLIRWTDYQRNLGTIAGYIVQKGHPALAVEKIMFYQYISMMRPSLIHIGGSFSLLDAEGRVNTHKETETSDSVQLQVLLLQLDYIMGSRAFGAEIEVDSHKGWSEPRSADGDVAKMREFLTVVDAIEKMKLGKYRVDLAKAKLI